jgi:cytochrome c556
MRTFHRLALGSVIALIAACTTNHEPAVSARTPEVPVGTIREVMKGIVEGSSQALFDSVAITSSAAGTIQKEPSTPEEWTALEHQALQLAEAPNLLKVPGRRVARSAEENTSAGPTELTPIQIQAKLAEYPALFDKYADDLQKVAQEALGVVKGKNVQGLFDIGQKLDVACENCHLEFWYPAEKKPE